MTQFYRCALCGADNLGVCRSEDPACAQAEQRPMPSSDSSVNTHYALADEATIRRRNTIRAAQLLENRANAMQPGGVQEAIYIVGAELLLALARILQSLPAGDRPGDITDAVGAARRSE